MKAGWKRVKFGEVVRQVKDKADPATSGLERYIGGEHMDTDDLRLRRWGEIGDDYLGPAFHMRFRPGQVLYGSRRTYLRKVAVADFEGICANTTYVLESANPNVMLPEFLPFLMQTEAFHEHSKRESKGSVNPYVNFSDLAWYEFVLPPVEEQRRIATSIDAIELSLNAVSEAIIRSRDLEKCFVHYVFEEFTTRYRDRRLIEGCIRITDGTHQSPQFVDSGVPFFLVKTISGGRVDWSHIKYVSPEVYQLLTRRVRPGRGDVLYTAVGTYGVGLLVDFDEPFVFQRHIAHIIPNRDVLLGEYIEAFLNSPRGKRQSDKNAIGSAQPTVTLGSLSGFTLPFAPIEDQTRFIERVNEIRGATLELENRKNRVSALRRAAIQGLHR